MFLQDLGSVENVNLRKEQPEWYVECSSCQTSDQISYISYFTSNSQRGVNCAPAKMGP